MGWPWHALHNWAPFSLDALGLVTLLGSEEVNASLGRLVPSRYVEYFPYLGAFVIAGDRFKEKKPSFNLYNITQGVHTTELSCWVTRWLLAQQFGKTRSIVQFDVADVPRSFWKWRLVSAILAFFPMGFLLAMTVLTEDWYGLANVVAMVLMVILRTDILQANRHGIDETIRKLGPVQVEHKKCLVVMSDSKVVTLHLPGHLIIPVFTDNPQVVHPARYHVERWLMWGAFAVHVLSIGNTRLAAAIYTVVLVVVPTVLMNWKLGCDDSQWVKKFNRMRGRPAAESYECWIGSRLKATVFEWGREVELTQDADLGIGLQGDTKIDTRGWYRLREDAPRPDTHKRQDLYAWLCLSEDEEASMAKWDLLPHQRNHNQDWWLDYQAKKALIQECVPFDLVSWRSRTKNTSKHAKSTVAMSTGSALSTSVQPPDIALTLRPAGRVNTDPAQLTPSGFIKRDSVGFDNLNPDARAAIALALRDSDPNIARALRTNDLDDEKSR